MTISPLQVGDQVVVEHEHFQQLLVALRSRDYEVVGPTVRDNAIVYDALTSVADLPIGYTDEQDGGTYRLKKLGDKALFGYAVGPHSWKKFLHPPITRLWQARREGVWPIATAAFSSWGCRGPVWRSGQRSVERKHSREQPAAWANRAECRC